ncbi:DUF1214 domain-containing protein [Nocardia salmonicida]|uniref:DUF1214 domain-containing protein n=1 Tax=Nocardia salmonicida TaxID=53431 RepID=UPI0033E298C8
MPCATTQPLTRINERTESAVPARTQPGRAHLLGPTPPTAGESNWIPTPEGRRFEALFRFYGPT